jgi:hypothetical protein
MDGGSICQIDTGRGSKDNTHRELQLLPFFQLLKQQQHDQGIRANVQLVRPRLELGPHIRRTLIRLPRQPTAVMSGEVELLEGGAGRGEDWRKKGRLRLGGSGPVGRGKDVNGEIDWLREDRDEGRADGVQFRGSQRDVENRTRREKEGTNRI